MNNIYNPKKLKDIIGYDNLLGEKGPLFKMLHEEKYYSFLLFGDPGIGKTSIIKALANESKLKTHQLNGANLVIADFKKIQNDLLEDGNRKIILMLDEIHRLNQEKQTFLLTLLDLPNFILFSTTTENPYIFIAPAIRSRLLIFEIKKENKTIVNGIYNRLKSMNLKQEYTYEQIELISKYRQYDIRGTLNLLSFIDDLYETTEINEELLERIFMLQDYDSFKDNSKLHDLKSAFQKSIRGSNVDGALFYLAALIKNKAFDILLRRLPIIAYEDIGLANPFLCSRVCIAVDECRKIGLPEARIILSNIVIEMCLSQKSNSAYKSIDYVLKYLNENVNYSIPNHLKDDNYDSHHNITKNNYKYPHNYENHFVVQRYLPENVNELFYNYDYSNEYETKLNLNYKKWTKKG